MNLFLESCCTNLEEANTAQDRGASRIELCVNLPIGGTTPPEKLTAAVKEAMDIPVNVLVRPRGGNFCYSEAEIMEMLDHIAACKRLGIDGIVIGALDSNGDVDMDAMQRLIDAARPLSVTFHRAFDVCRDPLSAFEDLLTLGCDRLLTSGHMDNAFEGRHFIAELVKRGGIIVMPGCGVRASNIEEIRSATGATEFHASASFWEHSL